MTLLLNETGVYLRRNYKAGNREKMILNGRFCNLNNGYFAVEKEIVNLRDIQDKREFNKALKRIDKNLKFSGNSKDYDFFRQVTGI